MKKKKAISYYKLELDKSKKLLHLAKAIDKSLYRLAYWMVARDEPLRNDTTVLLTKFKYSQRAESFLARMNKRPRMFIFKDTTPVVSFGSYDDTKDAIFISERVRGTGAFYPVLFHELTHAAGRKTRVPRPSTAYNTKSEKLTEEFIAEFGSLFLSSYFGVASRRFMESFASRITALTNTIKIDRRFKRGRLYYQPYIQEAMKAVKYLLLNEKI